jgi:hypothetical protein
VIKKPRGRGGNNPRWAAGGNSPRWAAEPEKVNKNIWFMLDGAGFLMVKNSL